MKHLKTVEWNNLLRHLASNHARKAIESHRGTRRNHRVTALWQKVAKATAVNADYQPAAESVPGAKAAFAIAGLAARRLEAGRLIHLLFDSFSHPAPAGTRSAPTRIRQLLYRAQPYQIDLQIELRQESNHLASPPITNHQSCL